MYSQKEQEETLRKDEEIFQNDTASSFAQQDNAECWVVIRFCDEYKNKKIRTGRQFMC